MARTLRQLASFDPFAGGRAELLEYLLLDVFAERPLEGNQLAVFTAAGDLEAATMQALARELRLSESVFLDAPREGGDARARIFTPAAELPFAGHPVLGAAAVLAGALGLERVVIETGAGPIEVRVRGDGTLASEATLTQPVPPSEPYGQDGALLGALGLECAVLPVEAYRNGPLHILVAAASTDAVATLDPDLRALEAIAGAAGVSCFAGGAGRFKTRMFAPGLGVAEDPATGSAAGPIAVHLVRHGRAACEEQLEISQGAELGRPSLLNARVVCEGEGPERVEVGGRVVMLGGGRLRTR